MKWHKLGRVFEPKGQYPWCLTHGMLPTPLYLRGNVYRVYFSGRDIKNESHIGYVDIDLVNPTQILDLSEKPVLSPGLLGTFDDSGVSPLIAERVTSTIVDLYYMGWHRESTIRVSEMTGRIFIEEGSQPIFARSRAPIMERTNIEPYGISVVSCILKEGGIYRAWYDSCDGWLNSQLPKYNIKYAEASHLGKWGRSGQVSVDYLYPNETRISRASVIPGDIYKMWYCYAIGRGGYRMGYGESEDGIKFTRMDDKAGIGLSVEGWDSEMVCYPSVFDHKGQLWMLYCGNGYGKTGFGIARWE